MEEENYYRLIGFIVDLIMNIFRKIMIHKIGHANFQNFLNHHKHKIYHLWINDTQCCQCYGSTKYLKERELSQEQVICLFRIDGHTKHGHHRIRDGKTTQHCLCKFYAKIGVTPDDLDIALACTIALSCIGKWNPLERKYIQTIKKLRNKISHVTCTKSLTTDEYERIWEKLEHSILYLADGVGKEFHQESKKTILSLKTRSLELKYCLKVYNVLKMWERRDILLIEQMDKMLFAQQHHSLLLEDHTSKFDDMVRTIQSDVQLVWREMGSDREITKRLTETTNSLCAFVQSQHEEIRKVQKQMSLINKKVSRLSKRRHQDTNNEVEKVTRVAFDELSHEDNLEENNYAKLSILNNKIFTSVLRRAFTMEWERQYPTIPWENNTSSKNRFLSMEKRPTKKREDLQR